MICYTGGAEGSDLLFEHECLKNEIDVIAYSFQSHKTTSKCRIMLTKEELHIGMDAIKLAARRLDRYFPPTNEHVKNLLLRSFWQVKDTNHIFAISVMEDSRLGKVAGGTGYAVAVGINTGKVVNLFDQARKKMVYMELSKKNVY